MHCDAPISGCDAPISGGGIFWAFSGFYGMGRAQKWGFWGLARAEDFLARSRFSVVS